MSLQSTAPRRIGLEILAASFIALFQELSLIRWLPAQIRVLAYFPNLVLIAAFLGLGVGALRSRSRSLLWLWPVSLAAICAWSLALRRIVFTQASTSEHLWLLYFDMPRSAPVINGVRLPIVGTFILTAISFVAIGQFVAERLARFREAELPLRGYAWDLFGSLCGVLAFAAMSFMHAKPLVWFAAIFVVALLLVRSTRTFAGVAVGAAVVLVTVAVSEAPARYSPYYALRIGIDPEDQSTSILTNGSLHQSMLPLKKSDRPPNWKQEGIRYGYHIPYGLLRNKPQRVLVLGAGSGNDVAVALDEGAAHVDAVEIDPVILQIGREMHPDKPYSSPKVRAINTDARAFLNDSREQYDLIVFGTLDSMTRLSALSTVRLDNFVYTVDCLRAAKKRLAPGGGVAMYFMVNVPFIQERLIGMITEVFGEPPSIVARGFRKFNRIYLAGPAFDHLRGGQTVTPEQRQDLITQVPLATDDWPYLYLESRGVTSFYVSIIAILAVLSIIAVLIASPELRSSVRDLRSWDAEMFLFGVAFLLLETKLVTEMNLAWGATWLTSAVVFGAILATVLLGTLLTHRVRLPWPVAFGGLVLCLIVNYLVPTRALAATSDVVRLAGSVLYVGLPVFFASICFALLYESREQPDLAFGWNLIGAVLGGLLEFTSMAIGLKALTLVALTAYLLAGFIRERQKHRAVVVTAPS